ncbi:hypothetical protein OEZ86_008976 [Tetradesmus obliquus]|nr:hypothetical protein OEZ86_008976 [Tetradesmus obliquus]
MSFLSSLAKEVSDKAVEVLPDDKKEAVKQLSRGDLSGVKQAAQGLAQDGHSSRAATPQAQDMQDLSQAHRHCNTHTRCPITSKLQAVPPAAAAAAAAAAAGSRRLRRVRAGSRSMAKMCMALQGRQLLLEAGRQQLLLATGQQGKQQN